MMDERLFWKLMEEARDEGAGDQDEQRAALKAKLVKLPPEDIGEFKELFHEVHVRSYDWTLWAAAYVINGGCSDDGFDYFRAWLMSKGEEVYKRAIEDPDSLVDVVGTDDDDADHEFELIMYSADEAYEQVKGERTPIKRYRTQSPHEPRGERWDEDNEDDLKSRVPRLCAKFWGK